MSPCRPAAGPWLSYLRGLAYAATGKHTMAARQFHNVIDRAGNEPTHLLHSLARERVISLIRAANAPSIRVAERLGERPDGRTEIFGQEALVYAIDRAGWRAVGGG